MLSNERKRLLVGQAVDDAWVEDARWTYLPTISRLVNQDEARDCYEKAFDAARTKYFHCEGIFPDGESRLTLVTALLAEAHS